MQQRASLLVGNKNSNSVVAIRTCGHQRLRVGDIAAESKEAGEADTGLAQLLQRLQQRGIRIRGGVGPPLNKLLQLEFNNYFGTQGNKLLD